MPQAIPAIIAIGSIEIVAGVTVATAVGWAAVLGGSAALGLALMPSSETTAAQQNPQKATQTLRQTNPVWQAAVGRCRMRASYMLYVERDGTSVDVMAFCHAGPIVGFVQPYLHDDAVTLDGNDIVTGVTDEAGGAPLGKGEGITSGNDGRYTGLVKIQFRRGDLAEDAYSSVAGIVPDLWIEGEHRGDGIASAALICEGVDDADAFQRAYPLGLPILSAVGDWLPEWDPRDTDQDADDPTTWGLSHNGVLHLLFFLTNEHVGWGFDRAAVIDPVIAQWKEEANLVDAAGWGSDGGWTLAEEPIEVVRRILASFDGWTAEDGEGNLVVVSGVYREPDFVIDWDEGDILAFAPNLEGVDDETAVNVLNFTYTSTEHDYREVAGDPWRDEVDIEARGQERARDLSLTWVQDHAQARQLSKLAMARFMSSARGRMETTLYGLAARGKRWIGLRVPFIPGLENCVIEVTRLTVDFTRMRVAFDWIKVDGATLSTFDPEEEGGSAPPVVPGAGDAVLQDSNLAPLQDSNGASILV